MPTKKAPAKKPPLPADIRDFLRDMESKCTEANRLIWSGIVDKKLKDALKDAGLTHETIALLGTLKSRSTRMKWEGVVKANYAQAVALYARAFDIGSIVDMLLDR